ISKPRTCWCRTPNSLKASSNLHTDKRRQGRSGGNRGAPGAVLSAGWVRNTRRLHQPAHRSVDPPSQLRSRCPASAASRPALHPERLRRHTDPSRPLQALQPVVCSLSQTSRLLSLGVTASHHRLSVSRSHRPKLPTSIVFDHRPCAQPFLRRSFVSQQFPEQETSTLLRFS